MRINLSSVDDFLSLSVHFLHFLLVNFFRIRASREPWEQESRDEFVGGGGWEGEEKEESVGGVQRDSLRITVSELFL